MVCSNEVFNFFSVRRFVISMKESRHCGVNRELDDLVRLRVRMHSRV